MFKSIIFAALLLVLPMETGLAEAVFFGKSCVMMPSGIKDCVTSTDRAEYERLKVKQAKRYDDAMRATLEDEAAGDKLLRQMLDILKDAEQK